MPRLLHDDPFRDFLGVDDTDTAAIVDAAAELAKGGIKMATKKGGTTTPTKPTPGAGAKGHGGSSILDTLKQNAVPIGIGAVALGAVYMLLKRKSRRR